jgi:hypothetical protein
MAHHDATGTPRPPFRDATSFPRTGLYPGCDTHTGQPPPGESGKCLLGGSPWQVTPSTIPGKDGGPVHHPAACPS